MILALDKHSALHVFASARDAEHHLEAIDVQQDAFEFCDVSGQRYVPAYTVAPKASRLGPICSVNIGAFRLVAEGSADSGLPMRFLEQAACIEHSSIPSITSMEALKHELRKRA